MDRNMILHLIRNPWSHAEAEVREARLAAADMIERLERELAKYRKCVDTPGSAMEWIAVMQADIDTKARLIQDLCAMQKEHEDRILAQGARVAELEAAIKAIIDSRDTDSEFARWVEARAGRTYTVDMHREHDQRLNEKINRRIAAREAMDRFRCAFNKTAAPNEVPK